MVVLTPEKFDRGYFSSGIAEESRLNREIALYTDILPWAVEGLHYLPGVLPDLLFIPPVPPKDLL